MTTPKTDTPEFYLCPTCDTLTNDEPKSVVVQEWVSVAGRGPQPINKVYVMCRFCRDRATERRN